MKYFVFIIIFIIIFAIAITLGSDNKEFVTFNFLIAQKEMRLSSLVAISFGFGFILAWLLSFIYVFKLKLKLTQANRKLKSLGKTVKAQTDEQKKQDLMKVE